MEANKEALAHLNVLMYSTSKESLQPNGDTYSLPPTSDANLRFMAQYLHQHKLHTKLMLSLGYWDPPFMRATIIVPALRQRFIQSIIKTLQNRAYGLQGVDIDWENEYWPSKGEKAAFPIFIKELALAMKRYGLTGDLLTLDIPPNHTDDYPDPKLWIRYVNWVNLMGYDFYGDVLSYTELDGTLGYDPIPYAAKAPTYTNTSLIGTLKQYEQKGIPKSKMVIILPLYGTMDQVSDTTSVGTHYGLRQHIIHNNAPTYYPYWVIYTKYGTYTHPKNGYSAHQYIFKSLHGPTFSAFALTKGTRFISYPDPIAIRQYADYLVAHNYLGISVWELSDSIKFGNPDSLIRAIAKAERRA